MLWRYLLARVGLVLLNPHKLSSQNPSPQPQLLSRMTGACCDEDDSGDYCL